MRNRLACVFAIVALIAAIAASPNFRVEDGPHAQAFAGDFIHEYLGAWIVRHGDPSRFYDPTYARAVQHDPTQMGFEWDEALWLPVVYPPFYYAALAPLSHLPFRAAALVFIALMAACFSIAVWLLLRTNPLRRELLPWILVVCGCFGPLWESLLSAQKGTLLLLILTGTWLLYDRGRRGMAGCMFGLLLIKPQLVPVIGIAMLLRREWAFVAGAVATGGMVVAASLGLGVDVCRQYAAVAATAGRFLDTPGFPLELMHCWYGFFRILFPGTGLALPQTATVVAIGGTIAVLIPLCRHREAESSADRALTFSGLIVATILLSFHLMEYDLTMLLLPGWLLTNLLLDGHPTTAPHRTSLVALLCLTFVFSSASSRLVPTFGIQLNVLVLASLLLVLARSGRGVSARRTDTRTAGDSRAERVRWRRHMPAATARAA